MLIITCFIMELTFTAKTITLLEKSMGKSIGAIVQEGGVTNYVALVQTGIGCSTNEAFDKVDEYLKSADGDLEQLGYIIMRALQEQGFLAKKLPLDKIQAMAGSFYNNLTNALDSGEVAKVEQTMQETTAKVEQVKEETVQ